MSPVKWKCPKGGSCLGTIGKSKIGIDANVNREDIDVYFPMLVGTPLVGIGDLFVDKGLRGTGIANALLIGAIRKFHDRAIILQAYPYEFDSGKEQNAIQKRLIKFYERFGFKHVGDGWMYRRPG